MSDLVIDIIPGAVLVVVGLFWLWRSPASNRRFMSLMIVGFALLLIAISIKHSSEFLAYLLGYGGFFIAVIGCYKHYRYRTAPERKGGKKK